MRREVGTPACPAAVTCHSAPHVFQQLEESSVLPPLVRVHTCMMCGGIRLGDRANDVEVLEQNNASCRSEVWGRPIQPFHSGDGYPGLAGLQHHHHSINVWDGDTCVFTKAPGRDTEVKNPGGWNGNDRERRSKGGWPWWQMVWVFLCTTTAVFRHHMTSMVCDSPFEQGTGLWRFKRVWTAVKSSSNISKQSQITGHVKLLANIPCNCHVFSD